LIGGQLLHQQKERISQGKGKQKSNKKSEDA
jgi:hypothetical protein